MIELNLKWTLVFAVAAVVTALLRRASAAQRHAVWMLAFAAVPIVALVPRLVPEDTPIFSIAVAAGVTQTQPRTMELFAPLWIAGTALLLARLVLSFVWLYSHRGRVGVPLTFGLFRPVVLLPESARDWSGELRASVMRHEEAHIRRRDTLAQFFTQMVCAFLWFHPLAWYAARRAAQERERACDDLVLANGVDPALYAAHLVAIARQAQRVPAAAIAMARASSLELRVRSILDGATARAGVTVRFRAAIGLAALLLVPTLSLLQAGDKVHKVGGPVETPRLIHKVEPKYTDEARDAKINGKVVLSVVVGKDGKARNIKVLEGLDPGLDKNAVAAVEQWRFQPGVKGGKPVAVRATIEVNFKLY